MPSDAILFLSVKPIHATKILSGEKKIELRRTQPKVVAGNIILLYATSPEKRILGYCSVKHVIQDNPHALWPKVCGLAAIEKEEYDAYFSGALMAVGIEVQNPHKLESSLALSDLKKRSPGFVVPQSYRYVAYLDEKLRSYLEEAICDAIPMPC